MPPFYLVLNEVQVHLKRITSSFKIRFICFAIEFLFITPPKNTSISTSSYVFKQSTFPEGIHTDT